MKRMICMMCMMIFLTGCQKPTNAMDVALQFRQNLNAGTACVFDVKITADYGKTCYAFMLNCEAEKDGSLTFNVTAPETISGIMGSISEKGGQLTFDDSALAFPLLADEQLSPISAPWIFIKSMRGGFITSAGMVDNQVRLIMEDSFQGDTLTVHTWLDANNMPILAEIYHNGYRILTLEMENFQIL